VRRACAQDQLLLRTLAAPSAPVARPAQTDAATTTVAEPAAATAVLPPR